MSEGRPGRPKGGRKFTAELLAPVVAESQTYAEVARKLGVSPKGGTMTLIVRYCREYDLDTSHMLGRHVSTGGTNRLAWRDILVDGRLAYRLHPHILRRAMIESGIPYLCFECGNSGEWRGKSLRLDIDHVNGDELDNRQENLRFACPNCHRQTETWGRV